MNRYKYQARVYTATSPAQLADEASRLGREGWRILQIISEEDRWLVFFEMSTSEPWNERYDGARS